MGRDSVLRDHCYKLLILHEIRNVFSTLPDFKGSFLNEKERPVMAREIKEVIKDFLISDLDLRKVCCLTVTQNFFLQTFFEIL